MVVVDITFSSMPDGTVRFFFFFTEQSISTFFLTYRLRMFCFCFLTGLTVADLVFPWYDFYQQYYFYFIWQQDLVH